MDNLAELTRERRREMMQNGLVLAITVPTAVNIRIDVAASDRAVSIAYQDELGSHLLIVEATDKLHVYKRR